MDSTDISDFITKSSIDDSEQITRLRQEIAANDFDLKESQELNEIIMLVVICMLVIIISAIIFMIAYLLCLRKKQERGLQMMAQNNLLSQVEMQQKQLEHDEASNMVNPGFESPENSAEVQFNDDKNVGSNRPFNLKKMPKNKHDEESLQVAGLPDGYSPRVGTLST